MYQSSFLKWAGGKTNALPHLLSKLPSSGDVLVEPFVGAGTVALNTNYKRYILNDTNPDLIETFKSVCSDASGFIADLEKLFTAENNEKEAFLALRSTFNATPPGWKRSLLFVYLNRHCYNGLMRYNGSGLFNTSFGKYKKPMIPKLEILYFANKFKDATFTCGCFSSMEIEEPNSVIYCDPPYFPASKTASFVGYTVDGFKTADHETLNLSAAQWRADGHHVFISNSDTPMTNSVYNGRKKIFQFDVRRSISTKGNNRGPAAEVLLRY